MILFCWSLHFFGAQQKTHTVKNSKNNRGILTIPSLPNTSWAGVLGMFFGVQTPPHKVSKEA